MSIAAKLLNVCLLGAVACAPLACGPIGPIAGGELEGEIAPAPSDWSFSDSERDLQLETRPEDPYSVNLWGVGIGGAFLLGSGRGGDARWVKHIVENPDVRLRVAERIFELRASRVEDEALKMDFLKAMKRKYDWEPRPEQIEEAWLFRLDPR